MPNVMYNACCYTAITPLPTKEKLILPCYIIQWQEKCDEPKLKKQVFYWMADVTSYLLKTLILKQGILHCESCGH